MNPETIQRLAAEALVRMDYYIARMVGQQKRRYTEYWSAK